MLATKILTQGHAEAMGLIDKLEGVRDDESGHRRSFQSLHDSLSLHMRQEEEIFYPALTAHEEFSDLLEYSIPEHESVRANLAQMSQLAPNTDEFQKLLTEMKLAVEAHATNEEEDVFSDAEELLGLDRMNELGESMDRMKSEMTRTAGM